jgi:hypothetical protein
MNEFSSRTPFCCCCRLWKLNLNIWYLAKIETHVHLVCVFLVIWLKRVGDADYDYVNWAIVLCLNFNSSLNDDVSIDACSFLIRKHKHNRVNKNNFKCSFGSAFFASFRGHSVGSLVCHYMCESEIRLYLLIMEMIVDVVVA